MAFNWDTEQVALWLTMGVILIRNIGLSYSCLWWKHALYPFIW